MQRVLCAVLISGGLMACGNEQGIIRTLNQPVAVTTGDFDFIGEPFNRMVLDYSTYDGVISVATWDSSYDSDDVLLKVEGLLGEDDEIEDYGSVFVASGTRGLGGTQYNGLLEDDHLVASDVVIENVRDYVEGGGVLVLTDWAYDLVEACWPDAIEFVRDDTILDDAQTGEIGSVSAEIRETALADSLDSLTVALDFNFSNWAVVESVSEDVTVWMDADVLYRESNDDGVIVQEASPLLVSFQPYGEGEFAGRVVYASFHFDVQKPTVLDEIIRTVIGEYKGEEVETAQVE